MKIEKKPLKRRKKRERGGEGEQGSNSSHLVPEEIEHPIRK